MTERKRENPDVEKEVRWTRNLKGGRTKELMITGIPRNQGEVDLDGLLQLIRTVKPVKPRPRRT